MTDPSADADHTPDARQPVGTPRWVEALGVVVLVLVAVLHLTGNSLGGPGSHLGLHEWDLRP